MQELSTEEQRAQWQREEAACEAHEREKAAILEHTAVASRRDKTLRAMSKVEILKS